VTFRLTFYRTLVRRRAIDAIDRAPT
jgi:hypothetical protein